MTCTSCKAATTTLGLWRQYNAPLCKYCSARWIQDLPRVAVKLDRQAVKTARLNVLADAVAHGHSEQEIRDLVALKTMVVQPVEVKKR